MKRETDICLLLGRRLRALRQERELTQAQMAELAEMNWRYYAEVERGQRNISILALEKIVDALELTLGDFFRFPEDRTLSEDEEKIIAAVTHVLSKGSRQKKHKVAVVLKEIAY